MRRSLLIFPFALVIAAAVSACANAQPMASPTTMATAGDPFPEVGTHWVAALQIDVCGQIQPNLASDADIPSHPGITASGSGLIDISPHVNSETGGHATLARFVAEYPGLTLSGS